MLAEATVKNPPSKFPLDQVRAVLRRELEEAAEESATVHDAWEPLLDSLRVVTVIATLEGLFDFPLPPEKVVRKGGYTSVDQGMDDVTGNLRQLWENHHN